MLLKYLTQKAEEEYHHINSWYFISFIFGIIYFFSNNFSLSDSFLSFITIIIILIFYFSSNLNQLLLKFGIYLYCFFIIGLIASNLRYAHIIATPINKNIISEVTGKVDYIKPTKNGDQVILSQVSISEQNIDLNKVRINIPKKLSSQIHIGDIIKLKAKLFPLQKSVLPGAYDFGFYLYMQNIEASGYAMSSTEIIAKNDRILYGLIEKIRGSIYHRLIQIMGIREGNFIAAILIGETKAIEPQVAENIRNSGIAHILSVSGLHLSLVALICFVSTRIILNFSNYLAYNANIKIISAILSIAGSFFYLLISGSNIAAVRAFVMTFIFIIAVIIGRSPYPMRSLMIAAFFILIFSPEYIFHPSFQLSFSAVLCLISGYEFYIKNKHFLGDNKGVIGSIKFYLFANIYSSFLASVVTAPFVIYHFYKFPPYSIIMNLLAVPLMSFAIMPLALLSLLLMPVGLDIIFLKFLGFWVRILIDSANYIASLKNAVWYFGHISPKSMILFAFGFFWIFLWHSKIRYLFGLPIIFISLIMMFCTPKPDFIYDHYQKAIGVKDESSLLKIYNDGTMSHFASQYWASWYGQKEVKIINKDIKNKNHYFITNFGQSISINHTECLPADIQIITSYKIKCRANKGIIITNQKLKDLNSLLIYCNKYSCEIVGGKHE